MFRTTVSAEPPKRVSRGHFSISDRQRTRMGCSSSTEAGAQSEPLNRSQPRREPTFHPIPDRYETIGTRCIAPNCWIPPHH